jgi:hypothetical protein
VTRCLVCGLRCGARDGMLLFLRAGREVWCHFGRCMRRYNEELAEVKQ